MVGVFCIEDLADAITTTSKVVTIASVKWNRTEHSRADIKRSFSFDLHRLCRRQPLRMGPVKSEYVLKNVQGTIT